MPPWLTDPEALGTAVGIAGAAFLAVMGGVITVVAGMVVLAVRLWRTKVKPELQATRRDARIAAHEVRPNSGHSLRDAVDSQGKLIVEMTAGLREIRVDQRTDRDAGDRAHSEIFRRLNSIESPDPERRSL